MTDFIENRTFDEIALGDSAELSRTLTEADIQMFAAMSGDVNPAHLDAEYAQSGMFHKIIAHGMWGGALISTVLGTMLPGPGTIYLDQSLKFRRPVGIGDTLRVRVTASEKDPRHHHIRFACDCRNQNDEVVIEGMADVIAPTEKIRRPRATLPHFHVYDSGARYRDLIALTRDLAPIRTAVIHPVDADSLHGAFDAAEDGLIVPILVGPEARIRAAAEAAGLDLAGIDIVPTEHSHAAAAAAVALCREGKAEALMKGALHTDEMMHAVMAHDTGLRTARKISHCFVMDVPSYPRPLFITDAAINIYPTLDDKRDIVQNAIDLAHVLGFANPRVAILSAVETVTPKIPSTLDAAALCKMADRGQITGALLDGPLAFDNAISVEAARTKGIVSDVAGLANILVVPDLEAGNMLAKQLTYLADAQGAGIVLGARVPIILTSRADSVLARKASSAVALLMARRKPGLAA